jgi:aryl-alcohol dehydrogenase-like predicted oxidoreductase
MGGAAESLSSYSFNHERNWKILAAVRATAAETGASPGAVSLAWLLSQPQVSSCILGVRSVAQMEETSRRPTWS